MSIVDEVAAAGGRVWLEGDAVEYRLPKERPDLLDTLRAHREEVIGELKAGEQTIKARCRDACAGLDASPEDLFAVLNDEDKAAQLDGREGVEVLRAVALAWADVERARLSTYRKRSNEHET